MEPVRTGFSTYIFEGDGVTNVFPLQFTLGELKRSYVTCQVADEVDGLGNPVYRELIEVPGDPSMIQIAGAVPAVGDKIEFRRVVPKDLLLHLYANGSILDYPSLDESHLQLMMALHEVLDGLGLKNVYTDINMHGYKLTNVFSDPDDPDSIATVAFLGTYRQDALNAAIAAANSALAALGHANTAAAQVTLCQDQVLIAKGHADGAALSAIAADGFADGAAQSALDAIAAVNSAAFTNLPIGTLVWHTGTTAFPGAIVADGKLRSRAAFPDLWAFAQTSGNISVNDASWTEGQYSPGDGSTTFRVPKVDNRFIRGKSATRAVGLVEEDAIRNIKGYFGLLGESASGLSIDATSSGVFTAKQTPNANLIAFSSSKNTRTTGYDFDASLTVPTADENRPKALTMLPCIKAYDVISDPNVLNAVEVVNDIARMMPRDENINLSVSVVASGTAVDFVGIPEGVKRITVMFNGVSTNGSSLVQVQLGSGVFKTTGYAAVSTLSAGSSVEISSGTSGFVIRWNAAALIITGSMSIARSSGNTFISSHSMYEMGGPRNIWGAGRLPNLSGTLDRLRITTVNGTDRFDGGIIDISWEF